MFSGYSPDAAADNFLREMRTHLPENFIRDQIAGSMDLFKRRLQLHQNQVNMCVASGLLETGCCCAALSRGARPVFTGELVGPWLGTRSHPAMTFSPNYCKK